MGEETAGFHPGEPIVREIADAVLEDARLRWGARADSPFIGVKTVTTPAGEPFGVEVVTNRSVLKGNPHGREEPTGTYHTERYFLRDGALQQDSVDRLVRQVRRHVRSAWRAEALGEDLDKPWAHTMHRLQLAGVREAGLDPLLALSREGRQAMIWLDKHDAADIGRVTIEDGRVDVGQVVFADGGLQILGGGRPGIIVRAALPGTIISAVRGNLLSDVVDHPAVRRAGPLRIEDVYVTEGDDPWTTFVVPDRQEFIRRPPKGMDRGWARMPFDPRPNDFG